MGLMAHKVLSATLAAEKQRNSLNENSEIILGVFY